MDRREYLKLLAGSATGLVAASGTAMACSESTSLDCGTWYSATVDSVDDGDTLTVTVDADGNCYEVRVLGIDTPETKSAKRYEKTQDWEFIEDLNYLTDWGENAKTYVEDELPDGTAVDVKLDCEAEKIDPFGRLLAKVRYDQSGDGTKNTVLEEDLLEKGYARVYAASMSNTDEYLDLQETARSNNRRVWQNDDGSSSEVNNVSVDETFHPHTSSIKLSGGSKLPDDRAPIWAEAEATQDNTSTSTVDYTSGHIPLVGTDYANNIAMLGGISINEDYNSDADSLEHDVFLANLMQDLGGTSGKVLVDGGHHTFNPTHAASGEDVAYFRRFLEGVGVEQHSINTYGDSTGYSLSDARALIVTGGKDSWRSGEVDEVSTFIDNGGVVILIGSHAATATMRSNLNALANDLGTDLRLNDDDVHDGTNNTGNENLVTSTNHNTTDFSLWSSYSESSNSAPACSIANPTDGAEVSGTVTIQVDASDNEDADDSLDVDVSIDGGSWIDTTYNSTSGYYEYDWDTTTVSDGSHTIDARATDSDGATTHASQITVSVDNTADAPVVDSVSISEVETSDSDAEFDVSWDVSDQDDDLDTVDVALDDTDDGEHEDSVSNAVSGGSASGTNRLVAAGEDGSGHTYEATVTVTDANGNTDSASASTTESEGSAPTVDSLSVSEVETSDSDAEFDASWDVGDSDGDLSTVELDLDDTTDGENEDAASIDVSGSDATGTTRLVAAGDDGSGNSYDVTCTVTDSQGNTASATKSITESESSNAPSVDSVSLTEQNGGGDPHAEFDGDWAVSDPNDDLDTVEFLLEDTDDNEIWYDESASISGGSASGTENMTAKQSENDGHTYEFTVTVTDATGNTDSATVSEVEDGS